MGKLVLIIFIIVLALLRLLYRSGRANYLVVSLFIQTLGLSFGLVIYEFNYTFNIGAFGNYFKIELFIFIVFLILIIGGVKYKKINDNFWLKLSLLFLVLMLYSALNPNNTKIISALVPLIYIFQLSIVLKLISSRFTAEDIFKGLYDGALILTGIEFILTLLYPIIGFESVVLALGGDSALNWANRRLPSSIGTFGHPGVLGIFVTFLASFFLASFLSNYKRKTSIILFLINVFVIFFTYSRTSYLILFGIISILIILNSETNVRKVSSLRNLSLLILFSIFFYVIIIYTPLSNIFTSDLILQVENRYLHVLLGYEIWVKNPILGAGLNTHVLYMQNSPFLIGGLGSLGDFLYENPIHNIHMIILSELGLVGFIAWIIYLSRSLLEKIRLQKIILEQKHNLVIEKTLNMTCLAILMAVIFYGFVGWAPFRPEIYGFVFAIIFLRNQIIYNK